MLDVILARSVTHCGGSPIAQRCSKKVSGVLGALDGIKKDAGVSDRRCAAVLEGVSVVGVEGIPESVCRGKGGERGTEVDQGEGVVGVPSHGGQVKVSGGGNGESAQVRPKKNVPCRAMSWSEFRPFRRCPLAEKSIRRSMAPWPF